MTHKTDDESLLIFADEEPEESAGDSREYWNILIADDEPDVHATTKMVLEDFEFEGRKLRFTSAYSGEEAYLLLKDNHDFAVILLDVVMESNHAGLKLAKLIREEMKNSFIRIILRTGQPGEAPEKKVISEYDINDYKDKGELTSQQLFTCMYSALRSYRDLNIIDKKETTSF